LKPQNEDTVYHSSSRSIAALALTSIAIISSGCGNGTATQVSSIAITGQPVISFPNRNDRLGTTILSSNAAAQQAGVDGQTLTITTQDLNRGTQQLTIDINGNMGLHGSYHSLSSRHMKKDIRNFAGDPIRVLEQTKIVTFRYRNEPETSPPHVGIIAEDAPVPVTDPNHRSFDLNNSLAITMAATRQLSERVAVLEARIAALQAANRGR
jgi:hypothetical protein